MSISGTVNGAYLCLCLALAVGSLQRADSRPRWPHVSRVFMGSHATIGGRDAMEDEHILVDRDRSNLHLAAVFDGHGGHDVSRKLKAELLTRMLQDKDMKLAGEDGIYRDQVLLDAVLGALSGIDTSVTAAPHMNRQGSTASVLIVNTDCSSDSIQALSLIAVNVGDSRIVLSRAGRAYVLTRDHKPNLPEEKARVEATGGRVVWTGLTTPGTRKPIPGTGIYRVNGVLAMSRAIGDANEKPAVSGTPDHLIISCNPSDEFVIVASDGLWDVFSSQDAVNFIHKFKNGLLLHGRSVTKLDREAFLNEAARSLVYAALERGSTDNVTVLLICLRQQGKKT